MDRLRPRHREVFSGFTDAEIEKMEKLLEKSGEESCSKEFCQKIAISFNRSAGRAGKPLIKWTEVQSWFKKGQQEHPKVIFAPNSGKNESKIPANCSTGKTNENSQTPKGQKIADISELEFEAKSSTDGAWYDVDMFLGHRFLGSGEAFLSDLLGLGRRRMNGLMCKRVLGSAQSPWKIRNVSRLKLETFFSASRRGGIMPFTMMLMSLEFRGECMILGAAGASSCYATIMITARREFA